MPAIENNYSPTGGQPVDIAYIGTKEIKNDTLCRSGVVWYGQFDIQTVEAVVASRLLKFPSVFIRADKLDDYKARIEASIAEDEATKGDSGQVSDDSEKQSEPSLSDVKVSDPAEDEAKAKVIAEIQTVIQSLDTENADHFTTKGKPKVEAVRARLPELEFTADDVALAYKGLEVG